MFTCSYIKTRGNWKNSKFSENTPPAELFFQFPMENPLTLKKASDPEKVLPGYFKTIKDPVSTLEYSTSSSSETDNSKSDLLANPTTAVEPPLIVQNKAVPDLALLTNSNTNGKTTVRENNERKSVFDFIVSRCPNFISEDVINSKSFISSMAQSLPQLTEFIDVQKTYMSGQLRNSGKTDLSKLFEEINSDIKNLNEKFQEASLITIDVSSGTDQLYVASAQKQILTLEKPTSKLQFLDCCNRVI